MRRAIHVAVAILFLWVAPVWSQTGGEMVLEAEKLIAEGDMDSALSFLNTALGMPVKREEAAKAHLLLGIVHLSGDKVDIAAREFGLSARAFPHLSPEEMGYTPDVVQLYRQQKRLLQGTVAVFSEPPGARVYVVDLHPGDIAPQNAPEADKEKKEGIDPTGEQPSPLQSAPASPTEPAGNMAGITPIVLDDLIEGEYALTLVKEGYRRGTTHATVTACGYGETFVTLRHEDYTKPVIVYDPPVQIRGGRSYRARATITDNTGLAKAILHYRTAEDPDFLEAEMAKVGENLYEAVVPAKRIRGDVLSHYITATDIAGNNGFTGSPMLAQTVTIEPLDRQPPTIFHEPLETTTDLSAPEITARVTDDDELVSVLIGFRQGGGADYVIEKMERGEKNMYTTTLPQQATTNGSVEYYIEATDRFGNRQYSGRPDRPHAIAVFNVSPVHEGNIAERKGNEVLVNVGTFHGVNNGDVLTALRTGKSIIDPSTGGVIGVEEVLTGMIEITGAGEGRSAGKIVKESGGEKVRVNDMVRLKPGRVQHLVGVSTRSRRIDLSWSPVFEAEVNGYNVYRSANPDGPFVKIKSIIGGNNTGAYDTGDWELRLEEGKQFYYRVAAFNREKVEGLSSEVVGVFVKSGPVPPASFVAVSNLVKRIDLSWQKGEGRDVNGYAVERADDPAGPFAEIMKITNVETLGGIHTGSKDAPLVDGKEYYFRIFSLDRQGEKGSPSPTVLATTRGKPSPPANLTVAGTRVGQVWLSWDIHPSVDVLGYYLYRSLQPDKEYFPVKEIVDRYTVEFTDDGATAPLEPGQTYYYMLTCYIDGDIESNPEGPVAVTTPALADPPIDLKVSKGESRRVTLAWRVNDTRNLSGFGVYRSQNGVDFHLVRRIMEPSARKYTDYGSTAGRLGVGTPYYYRMVSYNLLDAEGVSSETVKGVTKPPPTKPNGLNGSSGDVRQSHLSWYPNPERDIAEYRIWRMSGRGEYRLEARVKAGEASYTDMWLGNGETYYYRITAVDVDGLESDPSYEIFITTKPVPDPPTLPRADWDAEGSVTLSWTPPSGDESVQYNIYRKEMLKKELVGMAERPSFVMEKYKTDKPEIFLVTTVDQYGLESRPSQAIPVRPQGR